MSEQVPTIVLVHAHPDDEASTTGGTIAKYAGEGARVVLVTCTNGELGDSSTGAVPGDDHHDVDEVVAFRRGELAASCEILGIERLELLGYHDSGMMGWPQNDEPGSFWSTPVEEAATRLTAILDEEQPEVVITYDENGFYGHPDHIQANRITLAALERSTAQAKLYYPAIPESAFASMREAMSQAGEELPEGDDDSTEGGPVGVPDELIGAVLDISPWIGQKRAALAAHASQTTGSFFLTMSDELFATFLGREAYQRVADPTGQVGVEDDLLAGTRFALSS
jgi:LmbE family N-acetylglucosaminyl deacetylase